VRSSLLHMRAMQGERRPRSPRKLGWSFARAVFKRPLSIGFGAQSRRKSGSSRVDFKRGAVRRGRRNVRRVGGGCVPRRRSRCGRRAGSRRGCSLRRARGLSDGRRRRASDRRLRGPRRRVDVRRRGRRVDGASARRERNRRGRRGSPRGGRKPRRARVGAGGARGLPGYGRSRFAFAFGKIGAACPPMAPSKIGAACPPMAPSKIGAASRHHSRLRRVPDRPQHRRRRPPAASSDDRARTSNRRHRRCSPPTGVALEIGTRVGISWLGGTDGTCRFCHGGRENLCDAPGLSPDTTSMAAMRIRRRAR
jgi:hypothetical protein